MIRTFGDLDSVDEHDPSVRSSRHNLQPHFVYTTPENSIQDKTHIIWGISKQDASKIFTEGLVVQVDIIR